MNAMTQQNIASAYIGIGSIMPGRRFEHDRADPREPITVLDKKRDCYRR